MARLISIEDPLNCPPRLVLFAGDILVCWASGTRLPPTGAGAIELLGFFQSGEATATSDPGAALPAPAGPPDRVVFRARRPGLVIIELITGSPWHTPRATPLEIVVEEEA